MPNQQSEEPSTSGKKFILVAEDDKYYGNIYKVKLAKEGFDVEVATDGEQALKAARERKPDLILLDLIMPVKDGFATLEELKSDANLKSIKAVVLSNLGQDEDIKKAKKLGAADYLIKTNLPIQEMVAKVKEHLK